MLALSDAIREGKIPNAEIAIVVSDKAAARGVEAAKERGHEVVVIERSGRSREEHEREIISVLQQYQVDLVCLAGYMRLLSPCFIEAFRMRILNIHPSLLPAFPGLDAQRQALEHGVKMSGCTVHFVDNQYDHGPVLLQRQVEVLPDDTPESLQARVFAAECEAYPEALRRLAAGRIAVRDGDVATD